MALYRTDVILAPASALAQAEDIERVNTLLEAEGLGRPLSAGGRVTTGSMAVIPTRVDPAVVRDTLRRVRLRGDAVDQFELEYQYVPGTVGSGARSGNIEYYKAAGCRTGHGLGWLPAPGYAMPPQPAWQQEKGGRRPVVALLDTVVVADHNWLPAESEHDPFVTSWPPNAPFVETEHTNYRGHGTFNAGIIRITAPQARVLSVPVMSSEGRVDESKLVEALTELAQRIDGGLQVDVVCLPFGRHKDDDENALDAVKLALSRLAGVPVVASAGNDGTEQPVYPAAFATDTDLSVISVGSAESKRGTEPVKPAAYSNFGPWVREWRGGTNMLSLMPMPENVEPTQPRDGYAWWSGTSFAAVRYAAEVAGDRLVS